MKTFLLITASAFIIMGCNRPGSKDSEAGTESEPSFELTQLWSTDTVLKTCESVLYDDTRKVLFVSCIAGNPSVKDTMGYISTLHPDGSVVTLKWVDGLNAPKGMGIYDGKLYVTDIDELVVIDIENAEIEERIEVPGASFLNDISISDVGDVYFSDSDTGILWMYSEGELNQFVKNDLERPNGLLVEENRVLLTSSGSQDLKAIDKGTAMAETLTSDIGFGDGIVYTGKEGYYLTSSWAGEIFLILPDYSKVSLLKTSDEEINSADIGFNIREQVVYVPTFHDNRVVAYKLEMN